MSSRVICSYLKKHLKSNCFRNGETFQDYLKLWNVIDWISIAFGFTTVSLGKQDSFDSWRPAPQPCDQEPQFSDFCDQFRQFCSGGSIWFRFKGIGEFGQHTGCSDACCYSIVGYFFNYKLITRFDLSSCSRLVFCTQNCQLWFFMFFFVVFFYPPLL